MQVTIYKCDKCKKEIGNKKHLSLSFGQYSGVAVPPTAKGIHGNKRWSIETSVQGMFLHFCSTKHLAEYFDGLIEKATKKEKV